jgi:hypothetical protein
MSTAPAPGAPGSNDALLKDSGWSYHFQFTGIIQWHLQRPEQPDTGTGTRLFRHLHRFSRQKTLAGSLHLLQS